MNRRRWTALAAVLILLGLIVLFGFTASVAAMAAGYTLLGLGAGCLLFGYLGSHRTA